MRLDANTIIDNYRKIIIFLFIALIALSCASIVGNVIAMVMDKDLKIQSAEDAVPVVENDMFRMDRGVDFYSAIPERNIFDSLNRQPDEKKSSRPSDSDDSGERTISDGPPVKSSMSATLVGTMVFSNPSYSFAKVSRGGSSGDTQSYYIGDSLFGEAKVYAIERNRLYIERDGRREYLEVEGPKGSVMPSVSRSRASMPYSTPQAEPQDGSSSFSSDDVKSIGDNKFLLNKKMLDQLLSNYNAVLTQARAVPNFEDGKTNGFKIFAIRDGSIYSAIGIKNGDVLTRVNGQEINNLERVLSLFTQLRNESNISLDLVRGGQKISYQYDIR